LHFSEPTGSGKAEAEIRMSPACSPSRLPWCGSGLLQPARLDAPGSTLLASQPHYLMAKSSPGACSLRAASASR